MGSDPVFDGPIDEDMQAPDPTIDESLLQRARNGDRQAHATLYQAYAPMVFTLAYRMLGSKASAEDVLQDSFVEVIRKASDCRDDTAVGGWIKRIAINKCLSHLRSPWVARRTAATEDAWDGSFGTVTESFQADDDMQRLGRQQELERALGSLSATARIIVWLHDVEGYTHKEIGRLMGRSTSYSKSQLSRAYRQLRAFLHPETTDRVTEPCLTALKTV